jgi:hypothetical protein
VLVAVQVSTVETSVQFPEPYVKGTSVSVLRAPAYVPVVGETAVRRKSTDAMALDMYCGDRLVDEVFYGPIANVIRRRLQSGPARIRITLRRGRDGGTPRPSSATVDDRRRKSPPRNSRRFCLRSHKETYSMTNEELDRALRQLRLGGMADVLAIRAQQARAENLRPLDFLGMLVHDELQRRRDRLVSRRVKNAGFRDIKTLDTFDWSFNAGLRSRAYL